MNLEILRMYDDVLMPRRATSHSVGLDLYAYLKREDGRSNNMILPPRNTRAVRTGLIVKPPEGYAVFVCSRSGMAREHSLFVTNAPGVVDPDFRGEICVLVYNGGIETQYIYDGDRIGQMILLPSPIIDVVENPNMNLLTERGSAGWGSTGR